MLMTLILIVGQGMEARGQEVLTIEQMSTRIPTESALFETLIDDSNSFLFVDDKFEVDPRGDAPYRLVRLPVSEHTGQRIGQLQNLQDVQMIVVKVSEPTDLNILSDILLSGALSGFPKLRFVYIQKGELTERQRSELVRSLNSVTSQSIYVVYDGVAQVITIDSEH